MNNEKKKPSDYKLRIRVSEKSKETLARWQAALRTHYPGIEVSDSDLANWCIDSIGSELSKKQAGDIKSKFFDEEKQLAWLLSEIRAAKSAGQTERISQIMTSIRHQPKREKDGVPLPAHSS